MSKPRAGRVIRAWAVVNRRGVIEFAAWGRDGQRRAEEEAHELAQWGAPQTVMPLTNATGTWKPPAKAKKGKR